MKKNKMIKYIFITFSLLSLEIHSEDTRSLLHNLKPKNDVLQTATTTTHVQEQSKNTPPPPQKELNQADTDTTKILALKPPPAPDTKNAKEVLDFKPTKLSSIKANKKDSEKKTPTNKESNATKITPIKISDEDIKDDLKKHQIIRFYFENASLENLVHYMEEVFGITFFADDSIEPLPQGGSVLKGHKITFKTNSPLTREEAWNLFLKFLDIANLTVVPTDRDKFYYITSMAAANKEVIPTYFDTKVDDIPDNSGKVRYVFFLKNAPLATIQKLLATFASSTAQINTFPELNAIILVDKGSSIHSVMDLIKEFDKEVPECMSVLKLKKADAQDVAKLYADLTAVENPQGMGKLHTAAGATEGLFFPPGVRVLAEPRTNALILLGTKKGIAKVEEFVKTTIDRSLDMPYSPLYIYELQYTQAENMQRILSSVVDFGASTIAGQYGGVRDGDQYFRPMSITADTDGNRLIIKAEEADYLKLKEIIKKLDVLQPQVAIEVLIVDVEVSDTKELGAQIRQKYPTQPLPNMQFATSGMAADGAFYPPVMPPTGTPSSLLGNLIALANNQTPGSTLLSIGTSLTGGVWAMLRMLESFGKTDVISNPFLLTTNGYTAQVQLGTTRRINTSTSLSAGAAQQGFQPITANLVLTIKPQISTDGTIQMGIKIDITDFSSDTITDGNTNTKSVTTAAIVNDKEILALGGVIKTSTSVSLTKVPILGDIPVFGWLFRNKEKIKIQSNLLIFISPHIIYSNQQEVGKTYTKQKTENVKKVMAATTDSHGKKDPINAMFFNTQEQDDAFSFLNNMTPHEALHDIKKKKHHKKQDSAKTESISKKEKKRSKRKQSKKKQPGATS